MRPPRLFCLSILILLRISIAPQSLATPTGSSTKLSRRSDPGFVSTSPGQNALQHAPLRPRANFDSIYELPSGWVGRIQRQLSFLPVQVAAGYLTTFYYNVVTQVMSKWVDQPPVNHFTIGWENVQLDFYSATRTIPWDFVIAFAEKMLRETQRGFTGKYNVGRSFAFATRGTDTPRYIIYTCRQERKSLSLC